MADDAGRHTHRILKRADRCLPTLAGRCEERLIGTGGAGWRVAGLEGAIDLLHVIGNALRLPQQLLGDRKSTRSELQSLMRISYAVFCLKKKNHKQTQTQETTTTLK